MYLKLIQWDRLFFLHPWILPCSLLCTVINEITTNKQSRLPTGQALTDHEVLPLLDNAKLWASLW